MATNFAKCTEALNAQDIKTKYPGLAKQFSDWYDEGGWDDEGLNDEFLEDAEESSFVDWLKTNNAVKGDDDDADKAGLEIWQLLHDAILVKAPESGSEKDDEKKLTQQQQEEEQPQKKKVTIVANGGGGGGGMKRGDNMLRMDDSVIVKLLSKEIPQKERKKNIESGSSPLKKKIKNQAPLMLPKASNAGGGWSLSKKNNNAQDILHIELLGYKNNNYPLLIHFVDSAIRCQMNEWIKKGKKSDKKMSTNDFFEQYCNHPHFKQYVQNKNAKKILDLVKTAIDSYQGRILPPFQFMEPIWKINGNPLVLCNYMFEMARIARNSANQPIHNFTTIIPIQIEFLILNDKIKDARPAANDCVGVEALFSDEEESSNDEDDDDDDDDSEDEKEQIPSDLDQLLKSKKIHYHIYNNPLREMLRCTEDIKRVVDNKRCKRTVFILDRRNNKNKDNDHSGGTEGDKLYLFKPMKFNKFEDNDHERIHGALHHNSIKSMVPRPFSKNKGDDFNVRESLRGQMFVISYHIISKDEIRCYLFYQGQCFRFYGEDLINVLPIFFVDQKQARNIMLTKYKHEQKWRKAFDEFCNTFNDTKFEKFYYGLTGKSPRINVMH